MSKSTSSNDLLGLTARWTASVRSRESQRPDALFNDPWAAGLAGPQGQAWIEQRSPESVLPMVIRTRFFDEFLQRITGQAGLRQIVLLGAGLDTRAFRLAWPPKTHLFELDQPSVLAHKEQFLQTAGGQPRCERTAIQADLTFPWSAVLQNGGFEPGQPSGWLLEGLLFYLPDEKIAQILDEISNLAAPGSWLGFDIINDVMLTSPITRKWVEMQAQAGAPWIGTLSDPVEFLAERGWQANLTQAGAEDAHYGRWVYPVIPTTMADMPHNWYVTAVKTQ